MELIKLENIDVCIKKNKVLKRINLCIEDGDFIGIYGSNGSGKSVLSETISEKIKHSAGEVIIARGIKTAVVSSAEKDRMLEEDRYFDDSEFLHGKIDPGRSVSRILEFSLTKGDKQNNHFDIIKMLEIEHILDRGIRFLSTGEFRKMLIARAIISKADVIVLDDPFTGLDIDTRKKIANLLKRLPKKVRAVVLISGRTVDLEECKSFYFFEEGSLKRCNKGDLIRLFKKDNANLIKEIKLPQKQIEKKPKNRESLIRMRNVKMSFYGEKILTDINWEVKAGEHWQIVGPNGSGKSSLITLINGDSPKAYGQEIYLFNIKRGSGETVWEIKQKIGLVSGDLQRMHRIDQNVMSVVVSGFFDTIGLYDKPSPVQVEEAKKWCIGFGIEGIIEKKFSDLSEGLKRTVLIIRALVKNPKILILDEPCQGLDDNNSAYILKTAHQIINTSNTTLIYISHDPLYRLKGIDRLMHLVPHNDGGFTATINNTPVKSDV